MKTRFYVLIFFLVSSVSVTTEHIFADEITGASGSITTESGSSVITESGSSVITESGSSVTPENTQSGQLTEKQKEREKTINDINTFLIESYKIKIDKILIDLNTSIVRATKNDPVAQVQLLQKIQTDIRSKVLILESRRISENRKKILSAVFSYIQSNIDDSIKKISKENALK